MKCPDCNGVVGFVVETNVSDNINLKGKSYREVVEEANQLNKWFPEGDCRVICENCYVEMEDE